MRKNGIDGVPPSRRNNENRLNKNRWRGYSRKPDPDMFESKCKSCLQLDIIPKPKPDIFVNYRDSYHGDNYNLKDFFVAYSLEEDDTLSPIYFIYPPTFLAKDDYYFTRASCNGLLHFYDEKSGSQVLWNPTTGGYKILPKPFVEPHPRITSVPYSMGLWSDHRFEDYKVLNLVSSHLKVERGLPHMSYYIDLYSLKLNSWKRIPCPDFNCDDGYSAACVAGVFYCIASLKRTDVIFAFDFSTETISSLPLPLPPPDNLCDYYYYFLEYKGLLSALACWDYKDTCVPLKYELWIMSDGSWTKESVFHTRGGIQMPLWFSQDGKLLYFVSVTNELVMFDRANGELKHLGIEWASAHIRIKPMMIPFFESFVQLN
ncbi:F-box/kelch-repeat protein-like protein isoform X7 [Salvia divinorum]|uniref:F-box/kelch-repeat protein-like protein isoform X7 n=1 Tax=Salvia divinorum TaxID=28513 RepID=A0ABD1I081_SALDI